MIDYDSNTNVKYIFKDIILIQNEYYEKFLAESAIMFLNEGLKTPQMLK